MSTIGSLKRYSQASRVCGFEIGRPGASASDVAAGHVPAGNARIPASRDFSVAAYQRLDVEGCRAVAPRFRAFRAFRRIASAILQRLLVAMLESRRKQAAVMLLLWRTAHGGSPTRASAARETRPETPRKLRAFGATCASGRQETS